MKAALVNFWQGRSRREQWMLGVMVLLLAATILWLAVAMPLTRAIGDARERHAAAVVAQARIMAKIERLKTMRQAPRTRLSQPLKLLIDQSANETGFTLTRSELVNRSVINIAIPNARPAALFGWIAALDRQGVVVEQITIRENADQTLVVDARLRGRQS